MEEKGDVVGQGKKNTSPWVFEIQKQYCYQEIAILFLYFVGSVLAEIASCT